ncbi:hypothetical protein JW823_04620 [bacterium]|nr:hypothetical protein [candidate division CSSED10-310 bacterium]
MSWNFYEGKEKMRCFQMMIFLLLTGITVSGSDKWFTEHLFGTTCIESEFCIDSHGNPHCVGKIGGTNELVYYWKKNGSWFTESIASSASSFNRFEFELDENDIPHVIYQDFFSSRLMHSSKMNGEWIHETIESFNGKIKLGSFCIDSLGRLYLGYINADRSGVYAVKDADHWTLDVFHNDISLDNLWTYFNMALDRDNQPHFIYRGFHEYGEYIFYSCKLGTEWRIDRPDSRIESADGLEAMAFDNDNILHYVFTADGNIHHAVKEDGEWTIDTIENQGANYLKMKMKPNGQPGICYYYTDDQDLSYLAYAEKIGETWSIGTFRDDYERGFFPALAFDASGTAHIMTNVNIMKPQVMPDQVNRYYTVSEQTFSYENVIFDGIDGLNVSMAIDSRNYLYAAYSSLFGGELMLAVKDDYNWKKTVVDSTGFIETGIDLALDDNSVPHISYLDADNSLLKHVYLDVDQWKITTVDSTCYDGLTSIALDSAGVPSICYYKQSSGSLEYAVLEESGWVLEKVLDMQSGTYPVTLSLDLDQNDNPHIICHDALSDQVFYGVKNAGQWAIETLTNDCSSSAGVCMILDQSDVPHVLYSRSADYDQFIYATKISDEWVYKNISDFSSGYLPDKITMCFDSDNVLHASFDVHSSYDHALYYGNMADDRWSIQRVNSYSFQYSSIVVDSENTPHICYFANGLFHAFSVEDTYIKLEMPSSYFTPGDRCDCSVKIYYQGDADKFNGNLFVLLEVGGEFYFAPSFSDFDRYTLVVDSLTENQKIEVLQPFLWPEGAGTGTGITWYAAVTDQAATKLVSNLEVWSFGWGN